MAVFLNFDADPYDNPEAFSLILGKPADGDRVIVYAFTPDGLIFEVLVEARHFENPILMRKIIWDVIRPELMKRRAAVKAKSN